MKNIVITENQYKRIFENAATDVAKKMGWYSPPDPWKKKKLGNIDATGLIGEEVVTESRNKEYGGLEYLKKNQVPFTEEEKEYFKKHDVLTFPNSEMKLIHKAKAKNEEDGEVYFAFTHRAWNVVETKSEAVKIAKFMATTS